MDPPPPTTANHHHHYQDSIESSSVSSPTCRQWDDAHILPPPKLRMMCSYGGHIIPRPHDKTLCYIGGETRIVVADRHTSLADLCSRLSATLLNGRHFTLKYQLPTEDLDSLVSVTTDEDLENMVEEYDRLINASKPSRLRLFLFLTKPEATASMGSLLDDAKSETWFVDALNVAGLLPRGLSDPTTVDNLLEHKDSHMEPDLQRATLVETTSSFGSSSSSPSMSSLPPIKVKVDQVNQMMAGLDEPLNVIAHVPVSDHGAGMRKPPLPLQPVQRRFGHDAYSLASPDSKHGLHSPDSVASDSSIASANCQPKNRDTPTPPATTHIHPINYQLHDSSDTQPPSLNQDQQFYPHFFQQQPLSSYYHAYAPPPVDTQPYPPPLYFLPVTQNHPYATTSSSPATKTVIPLSNPDIVTNPIYGAGVIQVPSNQFQQQYTNVSQIPHHPPTPMPISNGTHPTQDPVYYSQHHPPLPSQYQSMNPGSAMLLTQVSSAQQPVQEIVKQ
ncbi:hypothetical protein R6Q57_029730 [Mikania cordata]